MNICCIACHVDSKFKLDCLLFNIRFFMKMSKYIVIVNSDGFTADDILFELQTLYVNIFNIANVDWATYRLKHSINDQSDTDTIDFYFKVGYNSKMYVYDESEVFVSLLNVENDSHYDMSKIYAFYLSEKTRIENGCYKNFIITNDSYILMRHLDDFELLFDEEIELTSFLTSYERQKHATTFLRRYNRDGLEKYIAFYLGVSDNLNDYQDLIDYVELSDLSTYKSVNTLYDCTDTVKNIHFDDKVYMNYLSKGYPAIKLRALYTARYSTIPDDYDPIIYKSLHKDLVNLDEKDITKHFLDIGVKEQRVYNKQGKKFFPLDFDPVKYTEINNDLKHMDCLTAKHHFVNCGIKEGRKYKDQNVLHIPGYLVDTIKKYQLITNVDFSSFLNYNDQEIICYLRLKDTLHELTNDELIPYRNQIILCGPSPEQSNVKKHYPTKFPYLFHKKMLGIESELVYDVKKAVPITKKYICAIHCYKLSNLEEFFSEHLDTLNSIFDIIVTYVIEDADFNRDYTFIKGNNYGMDVGPKYIVTDFLTDKDYNYIFYIHSKANKKRRDAYLLPYIRNFDKIKEQLKDNIVEGIFPPLLLYGKYSLNRNIKYVDKRDLWGRNSCYMEEACEYLSLDKNDYLFSEGNFYIVSRNVNEIIFKDMNLFSSLNTADSFDYNWVNNYYNLNEPDIKKVYIKFLRSKLNGNNLHTGKGWKGLADCMMEHIFERLMILVIKKIGKTFTVLDFPQLQINKLHGNNIDTIFETDMLIFNIDIVNIQLLKENINRLSPEFKRIVIVLYADKVNYNLDLTDIKSLIVNGKMTDDAAIEYQKIHCDLDEMDISQLKAHYVNYGSKEGRFIKDIPEVFILYSNRRNKDTRLKQIMECYNRSHYTRVLLGNSDDNSFYENPLQI